MSDPHEVLRADDDLGPLVERHGALEIEPADEFFQRFVVSVVRQQVSMAAASAIRERLFDAVEVSPEGILAAREADLREAGLSERKVDYVRNVAHRFSHEGFDREYFAGMSEEAVLGELTDITGVGEWTARMQLIFALGREDVFPVGDLGIRRGMHAVVDPDLDRAEMVEHAKRWAPYRSYASLYLWRATEEPNEDP